MPKEDKTITKYTSEQIDKMQSKFIGRDYSDTWYRKHFREMMRYIKWLNGNG